MNKHTVPETTNNWWTWQFQQEGKNFRYAVMAWATAVIQFICLIAIFLIATTSSSPIEIVKIISATTIYLSGWLVYWWLKAYAKAVREEKSGLYVFIIHFYSAIGGLLSNTILLCWLFVGGGYKNILFIFACFLHGAALCWCILDRFEVERPDKQKRPWGTRMPLFSKQSYGEYMQHKYTSCCYRYYWPTTINSGISTVRGLTFVVSGFILFIK